MPIPALILALVIAGCATLERRVDGWPELRITEHTGFTEVVSACWGAMSPAQRAMVAIVQPLNFLPPVPLGCAIFHLQEGWCRAYYHAIPDSADPLVRGPAEAIRDHEIAHCKGWDHGGQAQAIFDRWQAWRTGAEP